MLEAALIGSSVVVALTGVVLAWQKDRRSRARIARGHIEALHRLCLHAARRPETTSTPPSSRLPVALNRHLSQLPPVELIALGNAALSSAHRFAPLVFAAAFERLEELRAAEILRGDRLRGWPALCDSFSAAEPPPR